MAWQHTPYFIPLLISAGVSLVLAFYAWRRRAVVGAVPLALFMLAAAEWSLGYALELGSPELGPKLFWAKMQYFGIVTVAAMMLILVFQYTGREKWLTTRTLVLISLTPLTTLSLVWTNQAHHLIWLDVDLIRDGTSSILAFEHGQGFWLIIIYSYVCLLWGMLLLFQAWGYSPAVYRAQVAVMLAGTLAPWIGNALYISDLNPFPYLDLTPFTFTITGLATSWGLFRFQFLDVAPIARHAVLEGMRDAIIVLDRQGRIVDLNPTAEKILGGSLAGLLGRPGRPVLEAWSELIGQYWAAERSQAEIPRGEGAARRWYDLQIELLYNHRGRPTGRLIVLRDISKRKQVEKERERLIEELDAYAHTVAHDLKNPLTVVCGHIDLMEIKYGSTLDPTALRSIRMVQHGAHKMQAIIDALLMLASVRKQIEVPMEPLDMSAIVTDVLRRLDLMIEEYRAEIILPDSWPAATGYGPWVEEVWINYLSNALKYGGCPPRIEVGATLQPDNMVRCWVQDNGAGLTDIEQDQLFAPFTRLDQVAIEGHGLGLSIVRRIVEKLNGQVGVESAVGGGSTFIFTLPSAPAQTGLVSEAAVSN